jgi:hypothetical protein
MLREMQQILISIDLPLPIYYNTPIQITGGGWFKPSGPFRAFFIYMNFFQISYLSLPGI